MASQSGQVDRVGQPGGGVTLEPSPQAARKQRRYTNVAFTSFQVDREITLHKSISYIIWQKEKTSTGREHWQGYMQLKTDKHGNGLSFNQLKQVFTDMGHEKAHFESAKGDLASNIRYCSKEDTKLDGPWELGTPRRAGRARVSMEELQKLVDKFFAEHLTRICKVERGEYTKKWTCKKCMKNLVFNHGGETAWGTCSECVDDTEI